MEHSTVTLRPSMIQNKQLPPEDDVHLRSGRAVSILVEVLEHNLEDSNNRELSQLNSRL